MSDLSEFKFNKSSKKFRIAFIDAVKKFDFRIRAIVVNKSLIYSQRLKTHKEKKIDGAKKTGGKIKKMIKEVGK